MELLVQYFMEMCLLQVKDKQPQKYHQRETLALLSAANTNGQVCAHWTEHVFHAGSQRHEFKSSDGT